MKPAAVLIRALEVEIGRVTQCTTAVQHAGVGHTGVEPDIEDVTGLVVLIGIIAQQLGGIQIMPGINTVRLDTHSNLFHQALGVGMQFTAFLMHKQGDGHPPIALAGDTPIRTAVYHAFNARHAPLRGPLHLADGTKCLVFQVLLMHVDKPLRRGPKHDRCVVSPAVRIAVPDRLHTNEVAVLI